MKGQFGEQLLHGGPRLLAACRSNCNLGSVDGDQRELIGDEERIGANQHDNGDQG